MKTTILNMIFLMIISFYNVNLHIVTPGLLCLRFALVAVGGGGGGGGVE